MGVTKVATRVSDFEDLETSLKSGSDWVWLDSFSGDWEYLKEAVPALSKNGQSTCLVSPELQRVDSAPELKTLQEMIEKNSLKISSVCTKVPRNWEK
jgi:nicotinate-nucleotide pyrophosphorylase